MTSVYQTPNVKVLQTLDVDGASTFDQVTVDTTDGVFDVSGANDFDVHVAAKVLLEGVASSEFRVTGVNDGLTLETTGSGTSQVLVQSAGTGANAVFLNASSGGTDITAAGPVTVGAGAPSNFTVNGAGNNMTVSAVGGGTQSLILSSAGTGANAVDIDATAGGFAIDATKGSNVTVTGANENLTVSAAGGGATQSLILESAGTGGDAIDIHATAGGIIASGTSVTITGDTNSSFDVNGVDQGLQLSVAGGGTAQVIVLSSAGTGSSAIQLNATAGGFQVDGNAASQINVTNANLSLQTLSGGDIVLNPFGDIDCSNKKILNVAAPSGDNDAANKGYVDSIAQGLDAKQSVRASTTGALPAATYNNGTAGDGATLTADGNGEIPPQDGITLADDDRLLVKNQASAEHNGVYVVTDKGTAGTPFILTRADDFDTNDKMASAYFFVEEGTVNADAGYVCITNQPITVGTTAIDFTQFSGAGAIQAGAGMTKSGTTLNVIAGDSSLTVNADDMVVNQAFGFNWTGTHDFDAAVTMDQVTIDTTDNTFSVVGSNDFDFDVSAGSRIQVASNSASPTALVLNSFNAGAGSGDIVLDAKSTIELRGETFVDSNVFHQRDPAGPDEVYVSEVGRLQTTDATTQNLRIVTVPNGSAAFINVSIIARDTGTENTNIYQLRAGYSATGGTVTAIAGVDRFEQEEVAAWDATLDTTGNDVRVRVTGAAATTIDWSAHVNVIVA